MKIISLPTLIIGLTCVGTFYFTQTDQGVTTLNNFMRKCYVKRMKSVWAGPHPYPEQLRILHRYKDRAHVYDTTTGQEYIQEFEDNHTALIDRNDVIKVETWMRHDQRCDTDDGLFDYIYDPSAYVSLWDQPFMTIPDETTRKRRVSDYLDKKREELKQEYALNRAIAQEVRIKNQQKSMWWSLGVKRD